MEDFKIGSVVKGTVTGVENYGIFVKLENNYCGLIHISEIKDGFVKDITECAQIGEQIFVEILTIDNDTKKCVLSVKDLNYRENDDSLVKESVRGFSPLKHHLPIWINEKIEKIHKNEVNIDKMKKSD